MRLTLLAVGKADGTPEQALVELYLRRLPWPTRVVEVVERRRLHAAELTRREGELLLAKVPAGAHLVALDRAGPALDSAGFAGLLGQWRERGPRDLAFVIGGAEGLHQVVAARAQTRLSLGPMTWPHLLARVLLAEQLYRAASILAGHPYHR
ncbi:MAG: 23S rRNA (pseudouridine(1915)-N(3))-methyltransferase RlmH [Alphaproteobacteria bacterium]|nr:23S rRNA (pseudouridine(1915)-N(3))-methyltransferase RlmH [Alphaproteobacteria bacterium]